MHLAKVMRQRVVVETIYLPIPPWRENHLMAFMRTLRRKRDAAPAGLNASNCFSRQPADSIVLLNRSCWRQCAGHR
jgi:hypothetical protein